MNTVTATAAWKSSKIFVASLIEMGLLVEENKELTIVGDNGHMIEMLWTMEEKKKTVSENLTAEQKKKREDRALARAEGLKELAAELEVTLPESAIALDVTERAKPVLDAAGKKTGEKETTGFLVKLVYGKRGETRELRGTVSVGGSKKPKSEEEIDDEINALKRELFGNFLKIAE